MGFGGSKPKPEAEMEPAPPPNPDPAWQANDAAKSVKAAAKIAEQSVLAVVYA